MTLPGRVACCVPFCRRTRALEKIAPDDEWICGAHWRLVDRRRRRIYARAKRLGRLGVTGYLWPRLKVMAIEAAMGIA